LCTKAVTKLCVLARQSKLRPAILREALNHHITKQNAQDGTVSCNCCYM